jgi:hypothetical protein
VGVSGYTRLRVPVTACHIVTQTPDPHRCPDAHCALDVHVQ